MFFFALLHLCLEFCFAYDFTIKKIHWFFSLSITWKALSFNPLSLYYKTKSNNIHLLFLFIKGRMGFSSQHINLVRMSQTYSKRLNISLLASLTTFLPLKKKQHEVALLVRGLSVFYSDFIFNVSFVFFNTFCISLIKSLSLYRNVLIPTLFKSLYGGFRVFFYA